LPQLVASDSFLLTLSMPFHPRAHKLHSSLATKLLMLGVLLRSFGNRCEAGFEMFRLCGLVDTQAPNAKGRSSAVSYSNMLLFHSFADS
jgi:hypothetical protein